VARNRMYSDGSCLNDHDGCDLVRSLTQDTKKNVIHNDVHENEYTCKLLVRPGDRADGQTGRPNESF
jgi:hypothetical protein